MPKNFPNNYIDNGYASLPPQMLPMSEKDEDWGKLCMDRLETIGKSQHYTNVKLIENYEMVKGSFVFSHYFEDEGYADMVSQLTKEFDIPSYLRHYDICSQIINTMSGEWQKRPDIFKVKAFGEKYDNDFLRAKTEMLTNYIQFNINAEINNKLLAQGIDPNKSDFKSPEEQQQYLQLVEQKKQVLTPPEIELYMSTKWMQVAEIWGQHQLEFDKERFKFIEKEKREFEDMLIADRCFRHFYITGNSYNQETWNPINTFFHKSPEVEYIEEGDYVGRVHFLSLNDIIDRFGWMMDKDTMDQFKTNSDLKKFKDIDGNGIQTGSVVPYEGYGQVHVVNEALGFDPMTTMGIPTVGKEFFQSLNSNNYNINTAGLFQVTEAYWKSQRKIGKIIYFDEDGKLTKELVDENIIIPKDFVELESSIYDAEEPNTITWTWVNQVWKGIKISAANSRSFTEDLYLGVKPLEFQFKGDLNPYNAKLPVCGSIFSVRNSKSMSLVDLVKPHQIGYNVAMNQLYQIMEREIGRFIIMDVNMFPALKDWGGEKAFDKFMMVAKNLGIAPVDTSPQNTNGAGGAINGNFPRDINLDESARMASRVKIAEFFENMALKQVGFNDYRLGNYGSSATAAGIQQGNQTSANQTETYFTNFSNYLKRCYTMNLDIAQYVQSKKDDVTISYIKSDLSRAYIKVAGMDLLGNDMGVYVSNSQEQLRQLESLRQLGMSNTTQAPLPDLADIVTMNSPQEIKLQLQKSYKAQMARQDQQIQIQQQTLQQTQELEQLKQERDDARLDKELANKIQVAEIQASGRQQDNANGKPDGSGIDDFINQDKLAAQTSDNQSKNALAQDKQLAAKEKQISDKELSLKSLALEAERIRSNITIENKKLEVVKAMKGPNNKQ